MNVALIVLGVVLLIGAYFLYQYLTGQTATLVQNTYLRTQTAPIPITNFNSPTGVRCAYSMWLFVNAVDPTPVTRIFWISIPSAATTGGAAPTVANEPLLLALTQQSSLQVTVAGKTYTILDNFPLQKWERVDMSFDNKTLDFYLDGKLVKSFQMSVPLATPTTSVLNFGAIDAYVSGFKRQSSPMDPSTAWSVYMSGNKTFAASMVPNYGVTLALSKDAVTQKTITLF